MAQKKPYKIDYLNSYGGDFDTNSIGMVISQIISIDKPLASETYYTYDGMTSDHQINLFNSSSLFYKRLTKFLKITPYRIKKGIFKTLNYRMIVYISLYTLKQVFKRNNRLVIVYNGQPLIFKFIKKILRPEKLIFICHGGSLRVYNKEAGEKEILKYADTIVALNSQVYNEVRGVHNNVYLIPNYVQKRTKDIMHKNEFSFVYSGRIDANKRVKEICRIFKECFNNTDFKLDVCGTGNSTYYDETIKIIESSDNIEFRGYLDKVQLQELYKTATYIILISASEGSPLCLNEAYTYKVLPIGNTIPGIRDFIEAFSGILLPESQIFKTLEATFKQIRSNEQIDYFINEDAQKQSIFKREYFNSMYKEIVT